jgi:acetyl-CoA C-acetyltransferase
VYEAPRKDTLIEKLSTLRPVFKKDGVVTAGNASGINDGAAAVMLVSEQVVKKYNLKPLAEWTDSTIVGLNPKIMGMGPYYSIKKLLNQNKLKANDVNVYEINEAFASQSIACIEELGIDFRDVNPNGGAIALGHPLGGSVARILVILVHELKRTNAKLGVSSLCVGGGMGVATLIQNM